jgi:hypothetical protein
LDRRHFTATSLLPILRLLVCFEPPLIPAGVRLTEMALARLETGMTPTAFHNLRKGCRRENPEKPERFHYIQAPGPLLLSQAHRPGKGRQPPPELDQHVPCGYPLKECTRRLGSITSPGLRTPVSVQRRRTPAARSVTAGASATTVLYLTRVYQTFSSIHQSIYPSSGLRPPAVCCSARARNAAGEQMSRILDRKLLLAKMLERWTLLPRRLKRITFLCTDRTPQSIPCRT